jgi:hypothetical protein
MSYSKKSLYIQGGLDMTGTNCDLFTHKQSRSYLNHLVYNTYISSLKIVVERGVSYFLKNVNILWSLTLRHFMISHLITFYKFSPYRI